MYFSFILYYIVSGDKTREIRYCHVLNSNLPPDIRMLALAPVDLTFHASFGNGFILIVRVYLYYDYLNAFHTRVLFLQRF